MFGRNSTDFMFKLNGAPSKRVQKLSVSKAIDWSKRHTSEKKKINQPTILKKKEKIERINNLSSVECCSRRVRVAFHCCQYDRIYRGFKLVAVTLGYDSSDIVIRLRSHLKLELIGGSLLSTNLLMLSAKCCGFRIVWHPNTISKQQQQTKKSKEMNIQFK